MHRFELFSKEVALLLVDVQERLLPVMNEAEACLKANCNLAEGFGILDLPIFVTEQYPKGLGETVAPLREKLSGADVWDKISYTAVDETLLAKLKEKGIKQIVIGGIESHICVWMTARDLTNAGYEVFVAEDAVSSRTERNKQNAIALMRQYGIVVSNVETVLFDILKKAGSPEFKAISKLIK